MALRSASNFRQMSSATRVRSMRCPLSRASNARSAKCLSACAVARTALGLWPHARGGPLDALDTPPTLRYMSSEAIRIESETLNSLRERSAQSGEPIVRMAQRYIREGMRRDRHPGIVFRDGPAGRRAVVIGGPDVWEVIAAARSAPERGENLVHALAERIGVPVEKIRIAVSYYGEYPDEVDLFITANEQEAEQLERALENERRLLG
jgi:hypothetical protein